MPFLRPPLPETRLPALTGERGGTPIEGRSRRHRRPLPLPLVLATTAAMAAAGSGAASRSAACAPGGSSVDASAVAKQVAAILGGQGGDSSIRVEGLELPAEQIPHARTIVATGIALKVPERGQVVALATAIQESRLRNLTYGDRDSLGLFQQRPSQGWGTPEQIRDPVYASTKFYKGLLEVKGWQQMTITQAAQAVQLSDSRTRTRSGSRLPGPFSRPSSRRCRTAVRASPVRNRVPPGRRWRLQAGRGRSRLGLHPRRDRPRRVQDPR